MAAPGKGAGAGKSGMAGQVFSAAQIATDPTMTGGEKATEVAGAATTVGVTAAVSAVASPVAGKVAGELTARAVKSRSGRKILAAVGTVTVLMLVLPLVLVLSAVMHGSAVLAATAETSDDDGLPDCVGSGGGGGVGLTGLTQEQSDNAHTIINATTGRGLPASDVVIVVMTALTESSLRNVNHGDLAGPDSRGLFQQRDPWGPLEVRMDPAQSAGLFLDRLTSPSLKLYRTQTRVNADGVDSRRTYEPWLVAQSVQISAYADGSNYLAQYERAVSIVNEVLGEGSVPEGPWQPPTTGGADPAPALPSPGATPGIDDEPGEEGEGTDPADRDDEGGGPGAPCLPPPVLNPGTSPGAWGGHSNGQIPAEHLCALPAVHNPRPQYLRCDAAEQFIAMSAEYRKTFGTEIAVTEAYRNIETQRRYWANPPMGPGTAARPGTSNHGWGLAVDVGGTRRGDGSYEARKQSATYQWLAEHGGKYGFFELPSIREAWHWNYHGEWTG